MQFYVVPTEKIEKDFLEEHHSPAGEPITQFQVHTQSDHK